MRRVVDPATTLAMCKDAGLDLPTLAKWTDIPLERLQHEGAFTAYERLAILYSISIGQRVYRPQVAPANTTEGASLLPFFNTTPERMSIREKALAALNLLAAEARHEVYDQAREALKNS